MSNLSVSLIQTNPAWEDIPTNLKLFETKISKLEKGQVVVLPEMFNTGFSMNAEKLAEEMDGKTVSWMKKMAQQQQIILTGSVIIKEKDNYYNRLIWVLPNGEISTYDKRHLFSYTGEDQNYSAGAKQLIAQAAGWKIGLFICYDLRFPVWLRQPQQEETRYDLMIVVANWPTPRIEAWDTLLKARAMENQCFVAAVNRTGIDGNKISYNGHSAFYSPLGEELQKSEKEEIILQQALKKETIVTIRQQFPVLDDADGFAFKG